MRHGPGGLFERGHQALVVHNKTAPEMQQALLALRLRPALRPTDVPLSRLPSSNRQAVPSRLRNLCLIALMPGQVFGG